jgi:hypothetical protein
MFFFFFFIHGREKYSDKLLFLINYSYNVNPLIPSSFIFVIYFVYRIFSYKKTRLNKLLKKREENGMKQWR